MVQTSSTITPPKQLPPAGAAGRGGPPHGLRGAASKSYSVVGTCVHRLPAHSTCHAPDCSCASPYLHRPVPGSAPHSWTTNSCG